MQFERAAKSFGEDPKTAKADEFFGIFDLFVMTFTEAHAENERIKKMKTEEERRTRMEAQVSTKLTTLSPSNTD